MSNVYALYFYQLWTIKKNLQNVKNPEVAADS